MRYSVNEHKGLNMNKQQKSVFLAKLGKVSEVTFGPDGNIFEWYRRARIR